VVIQEYLLDRLVDVSEESVFGIRVDATPNDVLPIEPIGEQIRERRLSDAAFLASTRNSGRGLDGAGC